MTNTRLVFTNAVTKAAIVIEFQCSLHGLTEDITDSAAALAYSLAGKDSLEINSRTGYPVHGWFFRTTDTWDEIGGG